MSITHGGIQFISKTSDVSDGDLTWPVTVVLAGADVDASGPIPRGGDSRARGLGSSGARACPVNTDSRWHP